MFLKVFICILGVSSLFTTRAVAVQAGEVFWEVKKPGKPPNYLIGTKHDINLNKDSLPPELIAALKGSKIGLFELVTKDRTSEKISELERKMIRLPDGERLYLFI